MCQNICEEQYIRRQVCATVEVTLKKSPEKRIFPNVDDSFYSTPLTQMSFAHTNNMVENGVRYAEIVKKFLSDLVS